LFDLELLFIRQCQVELFGKEIDGLREHIALAAACKKPDDQTLQALLAPISDSIKATIHAKEVSRKDNEWLSHTSFLGEAAPCIAWIIQVCVLYLSRELDTVAQLI
jgi:adenylyl cyclase-associated protein